MFEDELAVVEESFRGLGRVREGVGEQAAWADEASLGEMLQATERLRRAADALELTVIGHAARWGEEVGDDHVYRPVHLHAGQVAEFAVEAVGLAVDAGPPEAGRRCDLAARAITDLSQLADLVAAGRMRERSLEVVAKETKDASPEAVAEIVAYLLLSLRGQPGTVRAGDLDERELRKAIRRMLARVEPEVLERKAQRNRREQLHIGFAAGPVGCSNMYATLPTEVALAIQAAVDAAAKICREDDPGLTAGAARAQGLADLVLRGVEVRAEVRLGLPLITSAASRLSFAPWGLEAPSSHLDQRDEIAEALHGPTAVGGRFVTGEGADAVDVLPEEWAGDAITSQVPTALGPGGPASWVSGCEVPGVGFVPADVVAALMTNLDTKISRALIDARTGVLMETSNPRYVVTDSMRDFVAARDETCRMWGCNRRIVTGCSQHDADLDHAVPYPEGPSCPTNLSGLCRHHHRLKHSPRWTHTLHEDGRTEWVSPTGAAASTHPGHWVHSLEEGQIPVPEEDRDRQPTYVLDEDGELARCHTGYAKFVGEAFGGALAPF
ncbi:HNH endonuclease signature motif containing protein [Janibacter sp. CX7]|uniref:HNH endonuclease signature motif containing protein n=1 Tax=Janibacter sp. CX7 TaxID=2963431 RepID=UPI0026EE4FEA|nr:HNH endonuclease signature motif containing protein [Janibacter sp. CX7]